MVTSNTVSAAVSLESAEQLNTPRILDLYWPLALSWLLMAVDAPVCAAMMTHKPHPNINLDAYQFFFAISLWLESPVIDLLSTSTTLVRGRYSHAKLRRFSLSAMALVTVVHGLVAFSPLYWIIAGILKVPEQVALVARPGFQLMLPWSAAIGWRRYLQGVLIRSGTTKPIMFGTGVRVLSVAVVAAALFLGTNLTGSELVGLTLIAGVGGEAAFIHWASRDAIAKMDAIDDSEFARDITNAKLLSFHAPLSLTSMVNLCTPLVITAAIDRLPFPVITLAAFLLSNNLSWLLRSFTYAIPEVVVTLYRGAQSGFVLRRFAMFIGVASCSLTILLSLSGLAALYFAKLLGAPAETARLAALGLAFSTGIQLLSAFICYICGVLAASHMTISRVFATVGAMAALVLALTIGVKMQANGIVVSMLAPTVSLIVELCILGFFWRKASLVSPI